MHKIVFSFEVNTEYQWYDEGSEGYYAEGNRRITSVGAHVSYGPLGRGISDAEESFAFVGWTS
jgi:hypothetical protein